LRFRNMLWKTAARVALHNMGGLAVLRSWHRREFGVLTFHSFSERDRTNVEAICAHIARRFEPVSLSAIVDALDGLKTLPDNAVAITVDDGYRSFLLHGHPIFRRHRIPVTLYAVAGFSDGRLWLWPDRIEFGLQHTTRSSIRMKLADGEPLELALRTPEQRVDAIRRLTEALKVVSNDRRVAFLAGLGSLCGVDIPPSPPSGYEAMSWVDLRAVASEGVEIGCHSDTHQILSRISNPLELESEIRGAKEKMEERLGFEVRHFSYPNGGAVDVSEAAVRCVRDAGFASAVSTTCGLNTMGADKFWIRRTSMGSEVEPHYGMELLAGLHM
jgi:peptidoglycan/xylan/chitin deacetylase (PgdA/CDA1 family)